MTILYLIDSDDGFFCGYRRRFPWFRFGPVFRRDAQPQYGEIRLFLNQTEADDFIRAHRADFPRSARSVKRELTLP